MRGHVRADQEVTRREVEAAGFRLVDRPGPDLRDNFFLQFERTP